MKGKSKKTKGEAVPRANRSLLRRFIGSTVVLLNVLAALTLIAASISDMISPEHFIGFAYLGLAYPFICVLNVGFLLYWVFAKRWFVFISLFAFLVSWQPTKNYFPLHPSVAIPDSNVIKVLTYNVMGFAYADHSESSPNRIVRYIAESDADIVCMQEYFVSRSSNKLTAQKLNAALSMYAYRSVVRLKGFDWGLALYSKYPILQSRRIPYPSRDNGSSIHQIDVNGKIVTVINNHLESFKLTSEDKSRYSEFISGTAPENFAGLSGTMHQKLGSAFRIRARQAEIIAEEIRRTHSDYIIVCGDFNDTPLSYAHRTIQGPVLQDAYAESGWGPGATYNQNYFRFRIDHILHSPNMEAMNCTVDKLKYSDHYPVWCYLKLN
ncbi:MAG: endonuclease/exonuclease/phosphatase family protein [Tannerellaceae bacterium]|jgi:endonuclease/exonuclease/phosphatase family metal-dependent hydrolase|nr:endonuclease/exonuclease/phosphatase family protein [Tannerellaceae bacterium]